MGEDPDGASGSSWAPEAQSQLRAQTKGTHPMDVDGRSDALHNKDVMGVGRYIDTDDDDDEDEEEQNGRRRKIPCTSSDGVRQRTQSQLPPSPTSSIPSSPGKKNRNSLPGISVDDLAISSPTPIARMHHIPHPVFDVTPATPTSPIDSNDNVSRPSTPARSPSGGVAVPTLENGTTQHVAHSSIADSSSRAISPDRRPSPRRTTLARLPSRVIADSPFSENAHSLASSPSQEHASLKTSHPTSSLTSSLKHTEERNDYRFPLMPSSQPEPAQDSERSYENEDYSLVISPQSEGGPSSPAPDLTPARNALRRNSGSSSVHSSQSVNEYSTPAGFLKHRRTSSMNAPKEVKESYNAGCQELPDGKRKLNQYVLTKDIGKGSFGVVQLAKDEESGKEFAVKEFSKNRLRRRAQSEMIRRQGRGGARRGAVPIRRQAPGNRNTSRSPARSEQENGKRDLDLIRSEVAIMKKVDHPNVVKLYEVLDIQEDDSLFMGE